MAQTRIAFIGCGSMAQKVHYPSLASFDEVELAAICDLDEARRNAVGDQYGIERRYDDYRRMCEETAPDGVYAIGPPHIMYDIWAWCLNQGLNLCIEKPLGLTLHQARSLAWLAEEHGCLTQVSFQRRACPMVAMLHQRCLERGPITHAVCRFYKHAPQPFLAARDHMMDDGVHAIDTLRWLCGGEVVDVRSICRRVGTPDLNFISATIEFENGAVGLMLNSWTSGRRIFDVEFHAPGICVEAEIEGTAKLYAEGETEGETFQTQAVAGSDENYVYGGFQAKNREFIDALQRGTPPPSHFGDAVRTMEVAERILAEALLTGR